MKPIPKLLISVFAFIGFTFTTYVAIQVILPKRDGSETVTYRGAPHNGTTWHIESDPSAYPRFKAWQARRNGDYSAALEWDKIEQNAKAHLNEQTWTYDGTEWKQEETK